MDFDSLVADNQAPIAKAAPNGSPSFDALPEDSETYGGIGGSLKAAALGAARSGTFGLSDEFLTGSGLMSPEDIKAYREHNPISSTVGEVGGVLGSVLAPEVGLLGAAAAPVKAVSRLGGAVTEAALPALSPAGKVLSQAGAMAAGSAVEGAVYGLGQSVTEHALGDPDLNGEKLFANVGTGAMLGGALGPLIGAGAEAIPAAIEKAGIKGEKARELVGDAIAKASSIVSGKAYEDIRPLTAGIGTKEGAAMRTQALEGYAERETTAREMTKALSEQHEAITKANREYYQGSRKEEITKLMGEVPHDRAFGAAVNEAGAVKQAIKEMRSEPELYSATGKIRQLELISESLEDKLANSKTAEDIYHAVNEAKQQIDPLAKFDGIPNSAERATIDKIKDVRFGLKTHLENAAVYGEAGARQGALNSAYSEYSTAAKNFLKSFGKKMANGETKVDPGKVNSFLNQMGRPGADIRQEILADYIDASRGLVKQMGESAQNSIKNVDTDKLLDLFKKSQGIAEGAESELESVNQLKRLKSFGDNPNIVGGAAMVGGAAHMMGVPVAAAESLYAVYHTLKHPEELVRVLSGVERAALKINNAVTKGSAAIFKVKDSLTPATTYGALQFASKEDRAKNHDKLSNHLNDMAGNPEKLIDSLNEKTLPFTNTAPGISQGIQGTMLRATQFLQNKLPGNNIPKAPLSPKYQPSDAELSKWHKYFSIVEDPTHALRQVAAGTIVPETMEALGVVYPKLLKEMQSVVGDKLIDAVSKKKTIPYRTKLSLSMFLGSDLVASLNPQSMLAVQNTLATATQAKAMQNASQMGSVNKKSLGKMEKSNRLMTPMQEAAQREDA